jgi:DNA-3-methyladenine glycosylase II
MIVKLDETSLKKACTTLADRDQALALVLRQYGFPPLWAREPGFSTLVHIILEQQVSLASANAAFARLTAHTNHQLTPETFLRINDEALKDIGFSRQKTAYVRHLSEAILQNHFRIDQLDALPDDEVRHQMTQLKGIGNWTADIYLSECLLRPDILPQGDIAMQEAFRVLNGLPRRPDHDTFVRATEHWRPWRSAGTRMLWHFYLSERR